MQNNNPKHFLSEEEFVQLRVELSKASVTGETGEDGEPIEPPAEDLPPGIEDLPDPAKVCLSPLPSPSPWQGLQTW